MKCISKIKHTVFKLNSISNSKFNHIIFTIFLSLILFAVFNSFSIFNEMPFFVSLGFKILSVLVLILINLYLIMSKNKEKINKMMFVQSGLGGVQNREKIALVVGYLLGNQSSLITLKNEFKEQRLNRLNTEILNKLHEIREGNAQLALINQEKTDQLIALAEIKAETGKYREFIILLREIQYQFQENIASFHDKSLTGETNPPCI